MPTNHFPFGKFRKIICFFLFPGNYSDFLWGKMKMIQAIWYILLFYYTFYYENVGL